MKSQCFQFYNKNEIAALMADNTVEPVVPNWFTYLVTTSLSDHFPGWCAVTIKPLRNTFNFPRAQEHKMVKGDDAAGLGWAEKHLNDDIHPGYHMDKTVPKDL